MKKRDAASISGASEFVPVKGEPFPVGIGESSDEWVREWGLGKREELVLKNEVRVESASYLFGESLAYRETQMVSIFAWPNFKDFQLFFFTLHFTLYSLFCVCG